MFREVVVDDQCVTPRFHEFLAYSATCIRCKVLQWGRVRGPCDYHNGMFHCTMLFKNRQGSSYCRILLTDCNINTQQVFTLLVDDGIDGNRAFSSLAVTNDQFALPTSNGNHTVNGLQTSLHRCIY